MVKKMIFTILLVISVSILLAQNKEYSPDIRPLNIVAVNFYGDASITSFNYERLLFLSPTIFLTGKLGIGFNEATLHYIFGYPSLTEEYLISILHHITCNIGKRIHFFEFGIGGSLVILNTDHDYFSIIITDRNYFLYPIIGYRIHPLKSDKVNFRIYGLIPFSGYDHGEIRFSTLGLSLGLCF